MRDEIAGRWRRTAKGRNRGRIAVVTGATAHRVEWRYEEPLIGAAREGEGLPPFVQVRDVRRDYFESHFEPVPEAPCETA